MPNGEKKEEVFTSSYRPLPEICLVGIEKAVDPILTDPEPLNSLSPEQGAVSEFTNPIEG
jgi:hypothetical protein